MSDRSMLQCLRCGKSIDPTTDDGLIVRGELFCDETCASGQLWQTMCSKHL